MSKFEMSLDEFMNNSLNEEKLERTYTQKELDEKYKKYKGFKTSTFKVYVYMDKHAKERFEERFVTGEKTVGAGNHLGAHIKFKDLPNWKKLSWKDYNRVLLDGIKDIINEHKLRLGGYFIISESTRLVIPTIIASLENDPNMRLVVINSTLHTGMSNIDTFHLGKKVYDHEDIKVEEFLAYLKDFYKGSFGILEENLFDHELGIHLEYTVEGEYGVNTNFPLIVVK